MKKFKKYVLTGAIVLTALTVLAPKTYAVNNVQSSLQEEYDGEIYAKKMYEQMVEKFDNDSYYSKLVKAETNHARVVSRAMAKLGYQVEEREVDVNTSDDELTALKEALKFENDDVAAYVSKIENAESEIEKAAYERLREGSKRHAGSLERAIEDFEKNGTISHNNSCENNRENNMRRNSSAANRGDNQKEMNRQKSNLNRNFGNCDGDCPQENNRQNKNLNRNERFNQNCDGDCPQENNRQNKNLNRNSMK